MEGTKFDRRSQTFVSCVGKQHYSVCVNYNSRKNHFRDCKFLYRPGFCRVCGPTSLFCPECPDCNIRNQGILDWLRLNYAIWPAQDIPSENALQADTTLVNTDAGSDIQLSEENRKLAVEDMYSQLVENSPDELMRQRPQLEDGQEIQVIILKK